MLKGADLAGLTTIFKNEGSELHEHDKLVDLFRSRAELKKEFDALRDEKYRLQDRIRQQAGATARVEQRLEHIENLLVDPDWVLNVVAFYQLRHLADQCEVELKDFAEQLKQQREKRLYKQSVAAWKKQRQRSIATKQRDLDEHRAQLRALQERLEAEQGRAAKIGAVARLVLGKAVGREVEAIGKRIEEGQLSEQEMMRVLQSVQTEGPPAQTGLDRATKRAINLQILAFAQQLFLQYSEGNLLKLAKEATEKSVGAIRYGDKPACDRILASLDKCRNENWLSEDFAEVLKRRIHLITQVAEYRDAEDTVPIPASVTTVFAVNGEGEVARSTADIIGENYFGIARILSR